MKKVYSKTDDVIHLFAQRTQDEARNSNNTVYFDCKDKLYSYGRHYLLAHFLDANTILINDTGYSVTTSKHISSVSYATSQYKQFFTTETNTKKVLNQIEDLTKKLLNARKPEKYISEINRLYTKLNEFITYQKATKTYKNTLSTPDYRAIKKLVKIANNSTSLEKLKQVEQKREKAKKLFIQKQLKKELIKFNNYEVNTIRLQNKEDYCRLSKCGQFVETTQNVKVGREAAKKLFALIKQGVQIRGLKIEGYSVTSLNNTLNIGCHSINIDNVHKIGALL